jgi:amino acid transporter
MALIPFICFFVIGIICIAIGAELLKDKKENNTVIPVSTGQKVGASFLIIFGIIMILYAFTIVGESLLSPRNK